MKKTDYKVTVRTMGHVYEQTGKTVSEALQKFDIPNVKSKTIISVEKGDYSRDRIIMPMIAARLFNSAGLTKEVAVKNVSMLF